MRLRFFVVSVSVAFLLFSGTAFSQTFNALFDGYYAWNMNKPSSQVTPYRSFDYRHQQFALNYAELSLEQKPKSVGYRFDFGFGDTATVVNAAEPAGNVYRHIQQAYISVNRNDMTFDFGKFVTPLGAEVIETKDNWNYSRSLLFTYAVPFYHFGVRATYAANDKTTVAAYIVNGWNNVQDNNQAKSVGIMATLKPIDKLTITENYLLGNENTKAPGFKSNRRHTFDSIATYEFNKNFSEMVNYDYGFDTDPFNVRRRWQGIAAYSKFNLNGEETGLKILPRYEWFKDDSGQLTGAKQVLQEATVTFQMVSKDQGTFWAEYRRDFSNIQVFTLNKASGNRPRLNQDTIIFGYTLSFSKDLK